MDNQIYLLLGSNIGDRTSILYEAINKIGIQIGSVTNQSSIYETAAWGITDQAPFLNQVIEISSPLAPQELLEKCNSIEGEMGRIRKEKWGPRVIDIDILYYGEQTINSQNLTIPHPEIQNRRFTLIPLVELNSTFQHPVLNKTNQEILKECKDELEVKKVD